MKSNRLATYAWGVLGFNVLVILWGAYVRATGSGAGCGNHWPLCNGNVIPRAPQLETLIEFSHRLSSGLALLLVAGLFVWTFRRRPAGDSARRGAAFSLAFILLEAAIGAGLVLLELVADNESTARAVSTSLHLVNTFLLLAALALTARALSGGAPVHLRGQGPALWALALGWVGLLVLGVSGAITALGDTLFPMSTLAEGIRQDLSPTAHLFIRLRVLHPMLAVVVGAYVAFTAGLIGLQRPHPGTKRLSRGLIALFAVQLVAGFVNVLLLAPVWMQMVHLLLADTVWVLLVLFTAEALSLGAPVMAEQPALPPAGSRRAA